MANTIKIKRGPEATLPASLAEGELAVTTDSHKLYVGTTEETLTQLNPEQIAIDTKTPLNNELLWVNPEEEEILTTVETTLHKVTVINETSSHDTYPSAKAVYNVTAGKVSSPAVLSIQVVDELPAVEEPGVLYLVKETEGIPSGTDIFTNYTLFDDYYLNSSGTIASSSGAYSVYISCEPNTTYTVNGVGNKLRVGSFPKVPTVGATATVNVKNDGAKQLSIATENDNYLFLYLGTSDNTAHSKEEILSGCSVIKD